MTTDFRDLLKQAKLPERTVPVCLRGDLVAEHESIERQLKVAEERPSTSLAGSGTGHLSDRLRELEDEMRAATYEFRLRALPRATWRDMVNAHPPREKDGEVVLEDRLAGVNRETFIEPLVRVSVIDPEPTEQEWTRFMSTLTDRQFDELVNAAWLLNQGSVDIPFSLAASQARQGSDAG